MWRVRAREKVGRVLGVYDGTKNVYFCPSACYSPSPCGARASLRCASLVRISQRNDQYGFELAHTVYTVCIPVHERGRARVQAIINSR